MNTPLDLQRLQNSLKSSVVGHTIDYHGQVASTMPIAHALARNPQVTAGSIVVAEEQTAGRGRMQRRWDAPYRQALLVSVILKHPLLSRFASPLPVLTAVATARTVATYHPALAGAVWLKWPNDVLLGNSPSTAGKVAGILIEAVYERGEMVHAIVGIGINANQVGEQFPTAPPTAPSGAPKPTSLYLFLGSTVDRTKLLTMLCRQLAACIETPVLSEELYQEWRSRMSTLTKHVVVHSFQDEEPSVVGQAVDVTPQGELIVVDHAGVRHTFNAGDVSVRATD